MVRPLSKEKRKMTTISWSTKSTVSALPQAATRVSHVTKSDLKRAVRKAKGIEIAVRFGCSERTIKITKAEALSFIDDAIENDGVTPHDVEMFGDEFGHTCANGWLWIG